MYLLINHINNYLMGRSILNIFRFIDVFGVKVQFGVKDRARYASTFGGLTFTFFVLFSLSYLILNFIPFITRKNINLFSSFKISNPPIEKNI